MRPVHPRSRGEHSTTGSMTHTFTGSSPLARGTHSSSAPTRPAQRLIPARAGNTTSLTMAAAATAAHPRSRGEHFFSYLRTRFLAGSSPLARGTLWVSLVCPRRTRLIPARAGNTAAFLPPGPAHPAHPRSRREHGGALFFQAPTDGSSPLARGTHRIAFNAPYWCRLIPARAGNTTVCMKSAPAMTAHPRSRGEHGNVAVLPCCYAGSSPLARGTHPS